MDEISIETVSDAKPLLKHAVSISPISFEVDSASALELNSSADIMTVEDLPVLSSGGVGEGGFDASSTRSLTKFPVSILKLPSVTLHAL